MRKFYTLISLSHLSKTGNESQDKDSSQVYLFVCAKHQIIFSYLEEVDWSIPYQPYILSIYKQQTRYEIPFCVY